MTTTTYELTSFITDLRTITAATTDLREIVTRVRPLARELAIGKTWLERKHYACDPAQGFGVGRGAPPHNHGTWAVVTGVDGPETNVFWKRVDDGSRPGYAEIVEQARKVFGAGESVTFLPDSIHSVINETADVTVSLHVYGKHINYTVRSQFDPARRVEQEFKVKESSAHDCTTVTIKAEGGRGGADAYSTWDTASSRSFCLDEARKVVVPLDHGTPALPKMPGGSGVSGVRRSSSSRCVTDVALNPAGGIGSSLKSRTCRPASTR
jgi:predicted metal-dependent enzyme (double-stranded beta helix superfamily)